MPFTKQCFSTKTNQFGKQIGKGLYCTSLKGSFQDSSLSFSQRNWMAPLISSEMWWITKLSSGYPIERRMPRGRNGELELAVPFPAWDELWLHLYLHHTWTHLSVTSSPCLHVAMLHSPRFVVQAPSPYGKVKHLSIGTLFFGGNSLADISSKTAMKPVLSYRSLSFTCPVSFLADHSKCEAFGVAQIIFQAVLSQFRAGVQWVNRCDLELELYCQTTNLSFDAQKICCRHLLCDFVLKPCKSQSNSVLVCEDTAQVNKRTPFNIIWQICLLQLLFYPTEKRYLIKCSSSFFFQKIIWHLQMGKIAINKTGIWCNEKQLFPFLMEGDHKESVRVIFFIQKLTQNRLLSLGRIYRF